MATLRRWTGWLWPGVRSPWHGWTRDEDEDDDEQDGVSAPATGDACVSGEAVGTRTSGLGLQTSD